MMQQRRKMYAWMAGISVLLLMLIVIQLVWLKKANEMQRAETINRVNKVLVNVQREVENRSSCFAAYSKTYIGSGDEFFMVHRRRDSARQLVSIDTLPIVYDYSAVKEDTVISDRLVSFRNPVELEMKLDFHYAMGDKEDAILQRYGFLNIDPSKTVKEVMANGLAVTDYLNMRDVDSIIKMNLQAEHVDTTGAGFGFINIANGKAVYTSRIPSTATLLHTPYYVTTFADNKFLPPHRLALYLPVSSDRSVGVLFWLLISCGVVALLAVAFYFFVRLYLRQTRLSEMKTDFINNLTHEFNTPMANIALAIETLDANGRVSDPKVGHILNIISSESFRLRENIERALQVATLEKGNLHLQKDKIDLVPLVTTVISGYQLQCEQLGGSLRFNHDERAVVIGDEVHLVNCVCNLLDNAIKYRQHEPQIEVSLEARGENVILTVSDNGQGMNSETMRHIFEKFYRAQHGNIHNTKGFGLGLNYVHGIIHLHGGEISVKSKPGIGTKFIIRLNGIDYGTGK